MALRQNVAVKSRLSSTLKSWLPILQSSLGDLEDAIKKIGEDNPCVEVESGFREEPRKIRASGGSRLSSGSSVSDRIESLSIHEDSLLDRLEAQISPPMFPTKKSQMIALSIINNLDESGFFVGNYEDMIKDLEQEEIFSSSDFDGRVAEMEAVRARFYNIEPTGIGAKDVVESLVFQLLDSDLSDGEYEVGMKIVRDLQNHAKYKHSEYYSSVMEKIRKFRHLPNIDYMQDSTAVVADILVVQENNNIELQINDSYYPNVVLSSPTLKGAKDDAFFKNKIREVRDLIDALEMRKATIRKIGLMIIEYQYDFFMGGDIKPMKLRDIAQELNHSTSTISRAIANKFLECNRGIFPLKSFFTAAVDGSTSNASIKDFLNELIKGEDKSKPLSDVKILELIENRFRLKMVRRTITKYRKQSGILGSSQRKRMYQMSLG